MMNLSPSLCLSTPRNEPFDAVFLYDFEGYDDVFLRAVDTLERNYSPMQCSVTSNESGKNRLSDSGKIIHREGFTPRKLDFNVTLGKKETNFHSFGQEYGSKLATWYEKYAKCSISACPSLEMLEALGELEPEKALLILSHSPKGDWDKAVDLDSLAKFKYMTLSEVDAWLCQMMHMKCKTNWSQQKGNHIVFHGIIDSEGLWSIKGPFFEQSGSPLQRVFGDAGVLRVHFSDHKNMDTVHGYYRRISRQGIWVGLRHYMFFAFKDPKGKKKQCRPGEEMLSVPKCFFVCTESLAKWDLVHAKFHHFQSIHEAQSYLMHIQTVTTNAKKISRLQLSLSQTLPILNLDSTDVNVEIIEDVYCRDKYGDIICDASGKSLIHTDGTGFISQDIAARCPSSVCKGSAKTRLSDGDHPLLLQVRVFREGMVAKGTLLVNLKLPPATIQLRKSMVKVTTDKMIVGPSYNSLEVCGTSRKPGKAKLSPYVALLLIYGGVPESTIMRFAEEELEEIVTTVKNRAAAISAMYSDMGDVCALRMLLANIPMDEPFLRKTLLDMTKSKLLDLSRGRVTIPDTYNFMGSADPTGRLERNQVVILLEHGPLYCPKVLVYKSPGLHVGDVKVFEATWHEDFKDIVGNGKYVIFFSVKGERSVVDEIANSDLDGDQYWCCWNSLIVKEFKPSDVWKNNDTVNKCPGNDEACIKDFRTIHFEAFLRARFKPSQTMGVAANSWQAHMDKYLMLDGNDPEKARLWHVIGQLVDTYYEAVDADKTGKQVSVHDSCRAREWPHYMEKEKEHGNKWIKKDVSYHSTTILGKIYDLVKGESITKDFVKNLESKVVEGSFVNKLFKYPGYEEYVSEWDKKFTSFRCKMAQLLRCKDFDNPNSEIESLFEEYKWELYKAETLIDSPEPIEVVLRKASAIYAVVYGHSQRRLEAMMEGDTAKTEVNLPLQFAWRVAGFALLKLFRENSEHKRAEPIMMEEEVLRQLKVARRERSRATETE